MNEKTRVDYSALDMPQVVERIFYPRKDRGWSGGGGEDRLEIPAGEGVTLDAAVHIAGRTAPNILFFHGNGEIVSDYNDLGPLYVQRNINFIVVDYRGYGRSTGTPTVSAMMSDCHVVFHYVSEWLRHNGFSGPMVVMGRSLGSASALELAANVREGVKALIVESGFAHTTPLLELLGVPVGKLGLLEESGFGNLPKIEKFHGPLLIIHAEFDHIIPYSDAVVLYEASPSRDKTLLKIPRANHNDIFHHGFMEYMAAVERLLERVP